MRCAGLDLGTTKVSAVLIETDPPPGRVLGVVSREHGAGLPSAQPWEHLQDPERILAEARRALGQLAELAAGPAGSAWDGLCVTGQMHGVLYADAGGRPVSPLMTWLDNRAGQPFGNSTWAKALSKAVGRPIAPGYGAATHFYNRHHDLVPPRAAFLCTIMDWVILQLTEGSAGRRPLTDGTIAASVGLADPRTGQEDPQALRESELGSVLPARILEAGGRAGGTLGGGGIPSGVPVFAPLGDNQAGFLGAVRDVEGMGLVNVGTGGQVSAWLPDASAAELSPAGRAKDLADISRDGLEVRPFPGGGVLLVSATLCAGRAYALLEELFRAVLETFGQPAAGTLYERMNELAASPAPASEDPLLVSTQFNGTRTEPRTRGNISFISLRNLTPGALVRGFLRGIASELGRHLEALGRRRKEPLRILAASGNGLRRNPALRELMASSFKVSLRVPRLGEEAALGAALAAAVGLGRYPGFRQAGEMIRYEGEEEPNG